MTCGWWKSFWHARKRQRTFNGLRGGPEWRCQCGLDYRLTPHYWNRLRLYMLAQPRRLKVSNKRRKSS